MAKHPAAKRKFLRVGPVVLLVYFIFFLLCTLLLPLCRRKAGGTAADSLSAETSDGERVASIDDNGEALVWRLRMIDAAQNDVVLSTYDLRGDNSGRDVMAALLRAADRGVNVRIIVDGMNGFLHLRGDDSFRALACAPNVEVKFYSPINLLKPWQLNYRLHDKYLIIDDTAYLLGGRNIHDLFLGDAADTYNIDRDVLVYQQTQDENASLPRLRAYFEEVWAIGGNRTVQPRRTKAVLEAQEELRALGDTLAERYPQAYEPFDWQSETIAAGSVRLLSNPTNVGNKSPRLWQALCQLMEEGQNIRIQTPYVICGRAMYDDLTAVCLAAESVQLMTNAVENGANPFGCSDYMNQKNRILRCGTDIWEWMGGQSLHGKAVLIDDNISVIGSFNFDMRSTYLDTELMVAIDCPELNRQLRESFDDMTQYSLLASAAGGEEPGPLYRPAGLPLGKKCLYGLLRVIAFPFRYLL